MSPPTIKLPTLLYPADQVREADRIAIEELGIPGLRLMRQAGEAACSTVRTNWPEAGSVVVLCGAGNNGGDGYVLARCLAETGLGVSVLQVGETAKLGADARAALEQLHAAGLASVPFEPAAALDGDVVVDAVFGTGLDRPVTGVWAAALAAINEAQRPVVSIDIPSGLHADTGRVLDIAVRADLTITYIALKQGLFTGEAPGYVGRLLFHDLGVPEHVYGSIRAGAERIELGSVSVPGRSPLAHKGMAGHLLVVGGERGFAGAPRMTAEAAARVGAGLVSLATRPAHVCGLVGGRPELMVHGVEEVCDLGPLLEKATVVAIGPGLGRGDWGRDLFELTLESGCPLVVDADALNVLAERDSATNHPRLVLTPHPGEAARLLGWTTGQVQDDRYGAVRELQARYGGVCVLKGPGTLVADGGERVRLCDRGTPALATGGTGDILTGIIAGLMCQGMSPAAAAAGGVWLHAVAAERASRGRARGMLATDLLGSLAVPLTAASVPMS